MKVFLLHPDRDFDFEAELPPNEEDLTTDLELSTLFAAMGGGDKFLQQVARLVVLSSLRDAETIRYRQQILTDCLARPDVVRDIYWTAVDALEGERQRYWGFYRGASPSSILHSAIRILEVFVDLLMHLRIVADQHAHEFSSDGFARLFSVLQEELGDEYFRTVKDHLKELKFGDGVLLSAALGPGSKGKDYVLRLPNRKQRRWTLRRGRTGFSFRIPDRDESGARALGELEAQGINLVANALAQSTDHIRSFFRVLRSELGYYVGCLNLHALLTEKGEPVCFPDPLGPGTAGFECQDLYDACLSLHVPTRVVGNSVDAGGRQLVVVTGANRGGKSTFLRSVGLAQLMMQSGMFVPARRFSAEICEGLFTHYKREEDASMEHGKLDEELARMSRIVDDISPGCLLLCNESFASTNEREGSEIGRQVIGALLHAGVKVFLVTHLFDLADEFHRARGSSSLFLRAERERDGGRTFRLVEAPPLATSFGMDLFRRIFLDARDSVGTEA